MKTVKKLIIERISSIDQSDGNASPGGNKKSTNKHKTGNNSSSTTNMLNEAHLVPSDIADDGGSNSGSSTGGITDTCYPSFGDSTAPFAMADPSPSPSIGATYETPPSSAEFQLTTTGGGDGSRSPIAAAVTSGTTANTSTSTSIYYSASPTTGSPFIFTPTSARGDVGSAVGVGGGVTNSISTSAIKPQKSRRKISLPWFRQSSVVHSGLALQYTIDTPGSFRLFRQTSNTFKIGSGHEGTWVVADYIATPGTSELSVSKGQQVEVVEALSTTEADFCLVRLNPQSDDAAIQEGLVPVSILKPTPSAQKNSSARKETNDVMQEQTNNRGKPDPLTSSTKRRGFSGPKWFPLRKHSQNKNEKTPTDKILTKKSSEKSLRLTQKQTEQDDKSLSTSVTTAGSRSHYGTSAATAAASQANAAQQAEYEAEEEAGLELPPPMKPLQEPHLMANGPPTFAKDHKKNSENMASAGKMDGNPAVDLLEIEQIVKEKTEQHEEKSKILKPNANNCSNSNADVCASNGCTTVGGEKADASDNYDNSNSYNHKEVRNTELSDIESALRKRQYAIDELITTEKSYIEDLKSIVNGYLAEVLDPKSDIPIPDDLKGGKERMVFGNIEAIYEWHKKFFLEALVRCRNSPADLGPIIKRYLPKFDMYNKYYQNKPVSDHIVTTHLLYFDQIRQKLGSRLDLNDLLIKPVQRLPKYELLFREIAKHARAAGRDAEVVGIEEAMRVMGMICKAANEAMELRRLQKFEGKITAQGKLLLHDKLTCVEDEKGAERNAYMMQKPRELYVFLFEQSIIFADIDGKKLQYSSPTYTYRWHLQVNKMQLEELTNNRFLLKSTDPNKPGLNIICYAATVELTMEWLRIIRNILQSQRDFLLAITSPIEYQQQQQQQN